MVDPKTIFSEVHMALSPFFIVLIGSGIVLFIGLLMLIYPLFSNILPFCFQTSSVTDKN